MEDMIMETLRNKNDVEILGFNPDDFTEEIKRLLNFQKTSDHMLKKLIEVNFLFYIFSHIL